MTVWGYPVVLWRFRRSCLTDAEHFTSIGFFDEFNDAWSCFEMFLIQHKCHCTEYDIHTLLYGVLLRVDFRNIVKPDLQTRLPELPEFL